ncbi:MAG: polyprenyl synthetase family protein [Candidatus Dormiibacterota bacterium]
MPGAAAGMPSPGEVSAEVSRVLTEFLDERRRDLARLQAELPRLVDELHGVLDSGGKRIRPWLACWGYRAADRALDESILRAASALELVHTFALIQDDVMDDSATRRGRPAAHTVLGLPTALLLSDLALIWGDQLLCEAGFTPERLADGLRVLNALRTEVTVGQYLDVEGRPDEARALEVNRLKTASYTVLRPIQLGLALGGARRTTIDAVPAYAEPAGIAFQLRDDVLGAFGDEATTGKPAGDDLRNEKPTWLWARALARGGAAPAGVVARRAWLVESGALADTEALIGELEKQALDGLRRLPVEEARRRELVAMTDALVRREQ